MFCSDIPPDIETVTISIYNKGKRSKDTEVGKLWIIFTFVAYTLGFNFNPIYLSG